MSVDEATKAYAALYEKVFSKHNRRKWKSDLFRSSTLEAAFKQIIADQLAKDQPNAALERMMDPRVENGACKT
jgi:hypothetical protein